MSDFEDKLNKLLSSPEEMEKVMNIARSLSESMGNGGQNNQHVSGASAKTNTSGGTIHRNPKNPQTNRSISQTLEPQDMNMDSLISAFNNIDPKMLSLMGRVLGGVNSTGSKAPLIEAIKPYVRESRFSQIESALRIARMASIARMAVSELPGDGFGV